MIFLYFEDLNTPNRHLESVILESVLWFQRSKIVQNKPPFRKSGYTKWATPTVENSFVEIFRTLIRFPKSLKIPWNNKKFTKFSLFLKVSHDSIKKNNISFSLLKTKIWSNKYILDEKSFKTYLIDKKCT